MPGKPLHRESADLVSHGGDPGVAISDPSAQSSRRFHLLLGLSEEHTGTLRGFKTVWNDYLDVLVRKGILTTAQLTFETLT